MNNEQAIEKIYDLVEMFDFDELQPNEKELVLNHMSKNEYESLRSTITDTRNFFATDSSEISTSKPSLLNKIVSYRIEIYKVAAAFLIAFASGFAVSLLLPKHSENLIALTDTVYVKHTDTLIIKLTDTVEKIIEKPVYVKAKEQVGTVLVSGKIPESVKPVSDCAKEICPDDLVKLCKKESDNNFSNDTELKGFLVSMN